MSRILIVGEIMSQKDMESGEAFSDGNGRFLKVMLRKKGIEPRECKFVNVFPITAARGSVLSLCGPKAEGIPHVKYLKRGHYVKKEYTAHLHNLWAIVNRERPNLILALGDAALWALTSHQSLEYARGYITEGNAAISGAKVLPTYHPRQIQQSHELMPIWLADLAKAKRESAFPEIRYPEHRIWIEPTLDDLETFYQAHIKGATHLSVDIENKPGMITCIGFAPSPEIALVIPFFDSRKEDGNYWSTLREEILAWRFVERMLRLPVKTGGHNFVYDMQVLYRLNGVACHNFAWDTMLMHHAAQPEMRKSLGLLASLYTDEVAWKKMRTDTLKKED